MWYLLLLTVVQNISVETARDMSRYLIEPLILIGVKTVINYI